MSSFEDPQGARYLRFPTLRAALRWGLVLPSSIASSLLALVAARLIARWFTAPFLGIDPDSWIFQVATDGAAQFGSGAFAVYIGSRVAPSHQRHVALSIATLVVAAAGFLLFPALLSRNGWAIYGCIALAVGAVSAAWSIYSNDESVTRASADASPAFYESHRAASQEALSAQRSTIVGAPRRLANDRVPGDLEQLHATGQRRVATEGASASQSTKAQSAARRQVTDAAIDQYSAQFQRSMQQSLSKKTAVPPAKPMCEKQSERRATPDAARTPSTEPSPERAQRVSEDEVDAMMAKVVERSRQMFSQASDITANIDPTHVSTMIGIVRTYLSDGLIEVRKVALALQEDWLRETGETFPERLRAYFAAAWKRLRNETINVDTVFGRAEVPAKSEVLTNDHPTPSSIELRPDNYPSVEAEPLSPVELQAKGHWERFCPSRVKHLRAMGGEQALETAIRKAWWEREYQTALAVARSPMLHPLQAQESFQTLLFPLPELSATSDLDTPPTDLKT